MQQRWWLIAVAILGVGLAVLLIPRPDTGEIPEAPPEIEPAPVAPRPPRPDKSDLIPGPPPGAEKVIAIRNRPSAKMSRELAAPLGGIRFALGRIGSDEAKDLSARIGEVQKQFAGHTSDTEGDLDEIIEAFAPLLEEIKNNYMDDADIAAGVKRYEASVESWNNSEE